MTPTTPPRRVFFRVRSQQIEGAHLIDAVGSQEEEWGWAELAARYLHPNLPVHVRADAARLLRRIQRDDCVGSLVVPLLPGVTLPLVLRGGGREYTHTLKRDPTLPTRLSNIYRVLDLDWGASIAVMGA